MSAIPYIGGDLAALAWTQCPSCLTTDCARLEPWPKDCLDARAEAQRRIADCISKTPNFRELYLTDHPERWFGVPRTSEGHDGPG